MSVAKYPKIQVVLFHQESKTVLTPEDVLEEGEKLQGQFNVEIARRLHGEWVSTVPPLYLILTDRRMIMQPQVRKRHQPAIIPISAIRRVVEMDHRFRFGVLIHLSNDMILSLLLPSNQSKAFVRHIRAVTLPPPPVEFVERIELGSLERIITFVKTL